MRSGRETSVGWLCKAVQCGSRKCEKDGRDVRPTGRTTLVHQSLNVAPRRRNTDARSHSTCRIDRSASQLLLTNSKSSDNVKITLRIDLSQIIQQAASSADHAQQTTSRGVVLLMCSHVFSQIVNPRGQDRDLYFGRSGIFITTLVFLD